MSGALISAEQRALEEPIGLALQEFFGLVRPVPVRSASAPYSHFCWIVEHPDCPLFIKAAGDEGLIEEALKVRAGEIGAQFSDEFAFHRLAAPLALPPLPRLMGTAAVGEGMRLLLLELLQGELLLVHDQGGPAWQECARVIARLNLELEKIVDSFPARTGLPGAAGNPELAYRRAIAAANTVSPALRDLLSRGEGIILNSLELVGKSATAAIHGELTPFNVFADRRTGRTVIIDWERFGKGPALFDLVTLLFAYPPGAPGAGEVVAAYHEEFAKLRGGRRQDFDRLLHATGIYQVLWLLLSIPEIYWHPGDEAKKARRRPAIEAMERSLRHFLGEFRQG